MEKNYMDPASLVEFEYISGSAKPHDHDNTELLFVLEGSLKVRADDREYLLRQEDLIVINSGRRHSYQSVGNLLAVRFQIAAAKLGEMLHKNMVLFWCCSAEENAPACDDVRKILKQILLYSVNRGSKDQFYLTSLHYQLISLLCSDFLLSVGPDESVQKKGKDRMEQIMAYIRANYRGPISLGDVAKEMYLSPTYLSKFIRRSSGKGFVDLISEVRLSHAMEDLIYTDDSVTKIAMDNGFASVAALNKVFRDVYDTTPSEYRRRKKNLRKEEAGQDTEEYLRKTAAYLHRHYRASEEEKTNEEYSLIIRTEPEGAPFLMSQLLNIGPAASLRSAAAQRELIMCKEHLGIFYVRIWGLFTPDLYFDKESLRGRLNFSRLDEILDFLVMNRMKPYFELRNKHVRHFAAPDRLLKLREEEVIFESELEQRRFFDELSAHLKKRFGAEEVSTWIFALSIGNDTVFEDGVFHFRPLDEEKWENYLREFDQTASVLRHAIPGIHVGGPDFPVHHYGADGMAKMLEKWREHPCRPDFISVTSFPYRIVQEEGVWYERRRTDLKFAIDDIRQTRLALTKSAMDDLTIHLTEFNLTLSDRSYINDTVMRAAFLSDTITELFQQVEFMGLWYARDAYSELADAGMYLFGGSGILTKTGAAKPCFYTLEFLNKLYRDYVRAQDGCLVSAGKPGHYKILAANPVNMSTAYYLKEETEISAMEIDQMTESEVRKKIHVRMEGLTAEYWQIRKYCLRRDSGSILGEWINLDMEENIRIEEMQYLERICTPRLFIQKLRARQGVLEFEIELEPNEVQYLHITEYS